MPTATLAAITHAVMSRPLVVNNDTQTRSGTTRCNRGWSSKREGTANASFQQTQHAYLVRPGPRLAPVKAAGCAHRLRWGKAASTVARMEAPKVRCAKHDNARRIEARTPPDPAVHQRQITRGTRGLCRADCVLHGRRRRIDSVLHGWRRRGNGSVFHWRRRLAFGELELVLER